MSWMHSLAPRDLRAFIALMASIGGTMALTLVMLWIIYILWLGGWSIGTEIVRIDKLGLIAVLVTTIMGVVMVSLGLAINRRVVKGSAFGATFEAAGGDDGPPIPDNTVAAAAAGAAAGATAAAAATAAPPPPPGPAMPPPPGATP